MNKLDTKRYSCDAPEPALERDVQVVRSICGALYCTILFCTALYSVLHCAVLHGTILYDTVLYCTELLYCTVLHYVVLYSLFALSSLSSSLLPSSPHSLSFLSSLLPISGMAVCRVKRQSSKGTPEQQTN
jgi:hypothetical protein